MKIKTINLLLPLLLMAVVFHIMAEVGAAVWIGGQVGVNFVANGDVEITTPPWTR